MDTQKHFPTTEKLHTDILEEKYDTIIADILRHDNVQEIVLGGDRIREVRMVDKHNILRTYAVTLLTYDKNDKDIAMIDDKIRNGGLVGKTFRENGFVVKKNVIDVFIIDIPDWMQKDFHHPQKKAKARLTEFYAKQIDSTVTPVVYGIVCEIYSPDFRNPDDGINEVDMDQVNPTTGSLQDSGVARDIIWERLDRAGEKEERSDVKNQYDIAKNSSIPIVTMLRNKVIDYINKK